ncbi:right-handed parallel beta-helix repeat-containing protein, partial [Microcoleus sp.]
VSELEHSRSQLQSDWETAHQERSQYYTQIAEMQSQLETAQQQQANLTAQVSELEHSRSQLQSDWETAHQERSQYYTQIAEMQSHLETAQQQQANLTAQVSELEHQLANFDREKLQLSTQLSEIPAQSLTGDGEIETPAAESEEIAASTFHDRISNSLELVVCQQGQGNYTTINEALQNAAPNTRIYVNPGLYLESLILDKSVEIIGKIEAGSIVVQSTNSNCLKMQTASALVRGLTLNATGNYYAVDIREGELVIEDSDITSADYSVVGICGHNAASVMRRCQIHDGIWNGIFMSDSAQLTVEDSHIFGNGTVGIGVGLGGKLIVRRCRITGNGSEAIALYRDAIAKVADCDLTGNSGGAWRLVDNGYVEGKNNQE